jgi:hypothetical protein
MGEHMNKDIELLTYGKAYSNCRVEVLQKISMEFTRQFRSQARGPRDNSEDMIQVFGSKILQV